MGQKPLDRPFTWEALVESARLGCGAIMLGYGRFALVDEDDMPELDRAKWGFHSGGYCKTTVGPAKKRVPLYMHRFISNPSEDMAVDHINHNKLDNRRANLRHCTYSQNCAHNPRRSHNKASQFKGVRRSMRSDSFQIRCILNGKETSKSGFKTEVEAAIAYNEWALKTFGEFAQLNEIP